MTSAFSRSLVRSPTSTPKPRAEGRVRAGGTQATSRPERERRPSPSAPAKNGEVSRVLTSPFFVSVPNVLATRCGCALRSACRGASACQWHASYEPTEPAGETSPSLHFHHVMEEPPSLSPLYSVLSHPASSILTRPILSSTQNAPGFALFGGGPGAVLCFCPFLPAKFAGRFLFTVPICLTD